MENTLPPFRAFSPYEEVRIYHSNSLPHWRQGGCTYFVTFRLADSLPQSVLAQLKEERDAWLTAHNINPESANWQSTFTNLPEEQRREYERQSAKSLNIELDQGYGSCVLRDPEISEMVADALEFYHGQRVWTIISWLPTCPNPNRLGQYLSF